MTDNEHAKPKDRSAHSEGEPTQPAEDLPDGSGSDNPNKDDTDRDTVSGGPAD
ncbi:hypothetical protein [Mycetocola zhadangensis]|uniref:hypothetical protein n=1 Tax=Mycetocola zhadangensis TaxID=1164595 RepID=UPI00160237B2|nr:hypothetical protein [Mycetocola zhadangensis]GGE94493.1 hypothetical protein GCM10011313_16850 [Mycetocola zhadangensis]